MEGDQETGVTLQLMVEKLDAGDVLGKRIIPISDDMDAMQLHDKMAELGADLLAMEFMDYLRGNLTGQPQDESQVTYAKKIKKSEAEIDWNLPARKIFNRMRGLVMGPGSWTLLGGKKLKILKAHPLPSNATGRPGEVVAVDDKGLAVCCGQGVLLVTEVQPESRSRMHVKDFLKGHGLRVGEILGE